MKEVTLNSDSFNLNPSFDGEYAILRHCYNLIVMKKGTDILNPNKGCDLNKYYFGFKNDISAPVLEQEIRDQITEYTDYYISSVNCAIVKSGSKWILHVFLSIVGLNVQLVISSNGENSQASIINKLTQEVMRAE